VAHDFPTFPVAKWRDERGFHRQDVDTVAEAVAVDHGQGVAHEGATEAT